MPALIGITTYGRGEKPVTCDSYDSHFTAPSVYVDTVRRAGAEAVLIPPGGSNHEAWLDRLDGLIVSGGADLDPALYDGNRAHPELGPVNAERDQFDLSLVPALLTRKLPVLFVCRGMQVLNVAMGGSLHEHLADIYPDNIHQGKGSFWADHEVTLDDGSRIAQIVRRTRLTVRSGNHQGVNRVADGLRVTARASDGLPVALERDDHPFFLGIQWHPETRAAHDPLQQAIIDALVAASQPKQAR